MNQNINRLDKLFGVMMVAEVSKRRPNFYGLQEFANKINAQQHCDSMGLGQQVNFAEGAPIFQQPAAIQYPGQQVVQQPPVDPISVLTEAITVLVGKVDILIDQKSTHQVQKNKDVTRQPKTL